MVRETVPDEQRPIVELEASLDGLQFHGLGLFP
jgi:hypothetical protein